MITQKLVKELFEYRDGKLFWTKKTSYQTKIGSRAGADDGNGYEIIGINKGRYRTHRIVFLMHHGYLPKYIDHIDGDRYNNCIENLRNSSLCQNQHNRKLSKNNASGIKGVSWCNKQRMWQTQVKKNSKAYAFGYFHDKEVAAQVVRIERLRLHGEYANHG